MPRQPRRQSDHDSPAPHASVPVLARQAATGMVVTLRENGFTAYFAGGCVRDEVMGLAPKDYDIATDATPKDVRRIFRSTRAVGEHFGVVLVRVDGHVVEVATFRSDDVYSDSRRPDAVAFTDARTDALRRDFTINGLFMDPVTSEVIDFVGGQADVAARIIRAIGDPDQRLAEDHLRALRAVRFSARLGFAIDASTAHAIRRHATELRGVSPERIGTEIRTMLEHESRADAVDQLQALGLDEPVLLEEPINSPAPTLRQLIIPDTATRDEIVVASLAAWAVDRRQFDAQLPARWRRALILSNIETDGLGQVMQAVAAMRGDWPALTVARRKRCAAGAWFDTARAVVTAIDPQLAARIHSDYADLSRTHGGIDPPPMFTGDDLIQMGVQPGPLYKSILNAVFDAQLEGNVATPDQAAQLAREILKEDE